jgi:hypothetical protein
MGDNAAFHDGEGIAQPGLVSALKALSDPPHDAELLARLIDGHAGTDLDFGLVGIEANLRSARRDVFKLMNTLKHAAQSLHALQGKHRELNLLELALEDLTADAGAGDVSGDYVRRLSAAVECLARVPLPSDLSSFGGKAVNDEAIQRVVDAVAAYYARMGAEFTGAPRRKQTDEGPKYALHSSQAKMTDAVLRVLGLSVPDKALATHISKARKARAASLPT